MSRAVDVVCYIEASQDLYAFSKLHTGLRLLAKSGEVSLRFSAPPKNQPFFCGYASTIVAIGGQGLQTRLLAVDLYDRADVFSHALLGSCDVYLKRSYYCPDVAHLRAAARDKILPFGLNYACRAISAPILAAIWPGLLMGSLRAVVEGSAAMRRRKQALAQWLPSPPYRQFEHESSLPLRPEIFFQTRLWTQAESDTEPVEPFNESRVALVRALRKHFPKNFRGGLIPTETARKHYPDTLTNQATRPSEYLAASKLSLIGISTRGLHHSVPFKLPEYLAGSKCIISEPLRNALPNPLVNGREILEFDSVEHCLTLCEDILAHPEHASELRHAAWKYYSAYVQPAAHVRNCLNTALAHPAPKT